MALVNVYEAKTRLSELLRRARKGEDITIAQAGVPIVRLVPVRDAKKMGRLGVDEGAFVVPDDFNEPILDDELGASLARADGSRRRSHRRNRKAKPSRTRRKSSK